MGSEDQWKLETDFLFYWQIANDIRAPHMWESHVSGPSLTGWKRRIYEATDLVAIIEEVVGREIAA
jgi:hypothetical protein